MLLLEKVKMKCQIQNQDISENDDNEGIDVYDVNSTLADKESIAKVGEDTDEDVQGYDEISVNENDDQIDYEVEENINDEVRGYE